MFFNPRKTIFHFLGAIVLLAMLAYATDLLYMSLHSVKSLDQFTAQISGNTLESLLLGNEDSAGRFPFELPAQPRDDGSINRQVFLRRIDSLVQNKPFWSNLFVNVAEALPLMLFLFLLRQNTESKSKILETLSSLTGLLLVFHFSLTILISVQGWLYNSPLTTWLNNRLAASELIHYFERGSSSGRYFGMGTFRLGTALFGVIVPVTLLYHARQLKPLKWGWLLNWLFWLAMIAGLALSINTRLNNSYMYVWVFFSLLTVVLLILLWAGIKLLTVRFLQAKVPNYWISGSMMLLVLAGWMVVLQNVTMEYGIPLYKYLLSIVLLVFAVGLALALSLAFFKSVLTYVRQVFGRFELPKRAWVAAFVMLLIASIPLAKLIDPGMHFAAKDYDVIYLAYRLDDLVPLIWIAGVVWYLYQVGKKNFKITVLTRQVGILAGTVVLFRTTSLWAGIPVTFLLGWLALEWTIAPAGKWKELKEYVQGIVTDRINLLETIANLSVAERSYQELYKQLGKKLADGSLDLPTFDEKLAAYRKNLDERTRNAMIGEKPVRELALNYGPYASSWGNAVHGAKWGAILALPWLMLSFGEFLTDRMPVQSYALWGLLISVVILLVRWVGTGFLFGYFFPYIRGKDGLQKAFFFFLLIVVPALPLTAISNTDPAGWQGTLFWALQVFIHCMLLGLVAFDYFTLRAGYRDWQMLFDIHGIPSVGLSLSTILAAIGAAIVTGIQAEGTTFITAALQFILPQIPNIEQLVP